MSGEPTTDVSFTRLEEETRRYWRRNRVFDAVRNARRDAPTCVIYQEPLQVAGQPWTDQARLLAHADLLARYHTMQGEAVYIRTGWACHGIAIELAVERALGSEEISYDLARFNAVCRETAIEGIDQCNLLADWLGVWLDEAGTYQTMAPQAIDATWRALGSLWNGKRLRQEHRVLPSCPRCATPLSAAETTRAITKIEGPSVWIRLPWRDEPDTYFLTWVPAPWMLVGLVSLAAHPDSSYVLVETEEHDEQPSYRILLAEAALPHAPLGAYRVLRKQSGKSLRGLQYRPPFTFIPTPEGAARLVLSKNVPLNKGSGLLPVTPAYHGLSLTIAHEHGLPIADLVDDSGKLGEAAGSWRGLDPLDSEPLLVEELQARGLLVRVESETRTQHLCRYCATPLLPQAHQAWLVDTAGGPWIVGRPRAWGAPMPMWSCSRCKKTLCIPSLDALGKKTEADLEQIELHRPQIDGLTILCTDCGGMMSRVPEVVDAAFEAAVLPWSMELQANIAHPSRADSQMDLAGESSRTIAVGLGDRDIGWLGDLAEAAAQLKGSLAWERALSISESIDDAIQNVDPTTPADALRWAVYTGTSPLQAEHEFLRPLWQWTVAQSSSQSRKEEPDDGPPSVEPHRDRHRSSEILDRWLDARLRQTAIAVSEALDRQSTSQAAGALSSYVRDLTHWYIPFRAGMIRTAMQPLTQLLAPFVPHLAEAIHRHTNDRATSSVHMDDWPRFDREAIDRMLLMDMDLAIRLADLGQTARSRARIDGRQTMSRALIGFRQQVHQDLATMKGLWADFLTVRKVEIISDMMSQVTWELALDPEHASPRDADIAEINATLADLPSQQVIAFVEQLWDGRSIGLDVSGQAITLLPDEVRVSVQAQSGWLAAAHIGCLVLLQTA